MGQKEKRLRDKGYLKYLRTKPCCNCYRIASDWLDVVPHHIRMATGGGVGVKPGDNHCVPLCVDCHSDLHQHGEKTFWHNCAIDPHKVAQFHWGQYKLIAGRGNSHPG
jgi:hypothetical protein